ncbi:MAG: hypothetical protein R2706_13370 [Acidimicrobiales bacterium]
MSLVSYSIMALTVFGLGFRLSHLSVVLSVATLSLVCGGIVALRTKRWPEFSKPAHAEYARQVAPHQIVVPFVAMASALLVAYGSVKVFPQTSRRILGDRIRWHVGADRIESFASMPHAMCRSSTRSRTRQPRSKTMSCELSPRR